jgi:hypothetical protein
MFGNFSFAIKIFLTFNLRETKGVSVFNDFPTNQRPKEITPFSLRSEAPAWTEHHIVVWFMWMKFRQVTGLPG